MLINRVCLRDSQELTLWRRGTRTQSARMKRRLTAAVVVWLLNQRHALGFVPNVSRGRIKKPACRSRLPVTRVQSSASTSADLDVEAQATAQATSLPDDWQNQILSGLSAIQDPDLNSDIVSLGFVSCINPSSSTTRDELEQVLYTSPNSLIFVRTG